MDYINAWYGWSDLRAGADPDGKDEDDAGRIMVLLVVTGAVLSALGWYEPFQVLVEPVPAYRCLALEMC